MKLLDRGGLVSGKYSGNMNNFKIINRNSLRYYSDLIYAETEKIYVRQLCVKVIFQR